MSIVLKDRYGNNKTYNYDTIFVQDVNGELVQFTQGKGESVLESLEVTENGTYTPNEGIDGFDSVTVDVKGAGDGSLEVGVYWKALDLPMPNTTGFTIFELNGELYALANKEATTDSGIFYFYKWENNAWTMVLGSYSFVNILATNYKAVVFNGKVHFAGNELKFHKSFDGITLTTHSDLPSNVSTGSLFVQNNKLKAYSYKNKSVYVWDEATDTWTIESTLSPSSGYLYFYNVDDVIYAVTSSKVYVYDGISLTQVETQSTIYAGNNAVVIGRKMYYNRSDTNKKLNFIYRYDTETNTLETIGSLPGGYSKYPLTVYQNKLALTAYLSMTYTPILVMHEVTE